MSQGYYKVTTGRIALHLEQGLAHLVNPQPAAAAINVRGFLGKAFVLGNGRKSLGLTSPTSDCSVEHQAPHLVRSQKGNTITPK